MNGFHLAACFVVLLACPTKSDATDPPARPPNIVFILADDLGYGDLACYGREDVRTPNLDKLASEGVRFTSCYANAPECTPTRVALLTGRYQQRVGGLECAIGTGNVGRYDEAIRLREINELGLPAEEQTITNLLHGAGYETVLSGKWHLGYEPKFAPHRSGFERALYCVGGEMDYFHYLDNVGAYNLLRDGKRVDAKGYATELFTQEAVAFIEQQHDRPFFLYLAYTTPHAPFQGPDDYLPEALPPDSPLWNQSKAPRETYVAMIESLDHGVGRVLAALEARGLADETVVIFSSDNGGTRSGRNAPLAGYKGSTFEGGIRVPAIARYPGVLPRGVVSDQLCATFDFTVSMASLAGVEAAPDRPFDGIDILAHVAKGEADRPRTLYWRKPRGESVWRAVRCGDLKYVAEFTGGRSEEHLYNLALDVGERRDIRGERPAEFRRLRTLYERWEDEVRRHRRGRPE